MRTVTLTDVPSSEWTSLRATGPVVLFGSFLSTYAPTALPGGEAVSGAIFDLLFDRPELAGLPWLRRDFERVPFEALMEAYPAGAELAKALVDVYGSNVTNPVYESLVEAARAGSISAFVTTNYDCAVEGALRPSDRLQPIVSRDDWEEWQYARSTLPLVKIHGTAEPSRAETLVFELRREGVLDDWKRDALRTLLAGRALVVVGFSGRDFDVCPELAAAPDLRGVYWLERDPRKLTPNAKRVLQAAGGTLVAGDLLDFLTAFLGHRVHADRPTTSIDVATRAFRPELLDLWRIRILSRMACRSLAEPLLDELSGVEPASLASLRVAMAGHAGRYHEIATTSDRLARQAEAAEAVRWHLSASFGWLAYGLLVRSGERIDAAVRLVQSIEDPATCADLTTEVLQSRLTLVMRRAQVADRLLRRQTADALRREAAVLQSQLMDDLTSGGALDARQAVHHNAQRLGVARSSSWPLPAESGFAMLGMRCMEGIRVRDWIRARLWWLSSARVDAARSWIGIADAYGWHHEAWKLRWIMFWRCPPRLRRLNPLTTVRHLRLALSDFLRVEYAPHWRLFQAAYSVIPAGDVSTFDAAVMGQSELPIPDARSIRSTI